MSPRVNDIAGVVVAVATLHDTQLAVIILTLVTVPLHPHPQDVIILRTSMFVVIYFS